MDFMSRPPRIGITLDHETTPTYSKLPWYAVRENYCTAVSRWGGMPLPLPHEPQLVESYLDLLDGLILTGGAFDVPPSYYGESGQHDTVITKDKRTQFEFAITKGALARKLPILGICGGEQLLNVALGGSLIQHIPDTIAQALAHEQPNPRHEPGHTVKLTAGTLLHRIAGTEQLSVNSAHHQAVARLAPGMIANAYAEDGVIEGIEYPDHPFCLGVQWHPEYDVSSADPQIFQAFLAATNR